MSDRVAIMRDGPIEQIDTPEALYRRPATLFAARFLGEANLCPSAKAASLGFGAAGHRALRAWPWSPEDLDARLTAAAGGRRRCGRRSSRASFQGTRYRIEGRHPTCGTIVATLPPDTPPSLIGPGSTLELARSCVGPVHVLGESLPRARAEAELAAAAR